MGEDWQLVYSTGQSYEAEMVRGLLETAGLEPVVMNKQDSSYLFGDIEVYVAPAQAEQALSIIKNIENE
jgi:hypothetical protein